MFRKLYLFPSSNEGMETPVLLGPLVFRIPDDGRIPESH
jgi:hypothetical protein